MRHTKLIAFEPGGNVGVGFGVYVGVHADADGCTFAHALCHVAQDFQLGFAFHVKARNAYFQSLAHLGACFAHA